MSKKQIDSGKDVIVTNPMIGICFMQVCAINGTSDKRILEICNDENPSGTSAGWGSVFKEDDEPENLRPVPCEEHPNRTHYIVAC